MLIIMYHLRLFELELASEVLPNMQTSDVDRDDKTNIMRLGP